MGAKKQPILAGSVISPVRYAEGETSVREHLAYKRLGPTPFMMPGSLHLTSERLVWTSLGFVHIIRLDDIKVVSLHHDIWPGIRGRSSSLKVETKHDSSFFQFRPFHREAFSGTLWKPSRQKAEAHRWVGLVKHWAHLSS